MSTLENIDREYIWIFTKYVWMFEGIPKAEDINVSHFFWCLVQWIYALILIFHLSYICRYTYPNFSIAQYSGFAAFSWWPHLPIWLTLLCPWVIYDEAAWFMLHRFIFNILRICFSNNTLTLQILKNELCPH